MNVEIIKIENLESLSEEAVLEIAKQEREWFGKEPFGEYLICKNRSCRKLKSAEEAFQNRDAGLAELEETYEPNKICPKCENHMEEFTPLESLIKYLKFLYSHESYGTFARTQSGELVGESITLCAPFHLAHKSINYRNGYDLEKFRRLAFQRTGLRLADDTKMVCANRIAIKESHRSKGLYRRLLGDNINMRPDLDHSPGIGDTLITTRIFPLVTATGYMPMEFDYTGGTSLFCPKFGEFRKSFLINEEAFEQNYRRALQQQRRLQRNLIRRLPIINDRAYPNSNLLSEIFL